jgi:hypothetical protein
MPRYMPQNVFDLIVIADLTASLIYDSDEANRRLNRVIEGYLRSYPSEERGQLKSDIYTASYLSAGAVESIRDIYRAAGMDDSEQRAHTVSALERIFETLRKNSDSKKSAFRRIFGGNRISRSRDNISSAALVFSVGIEVRRAQP